MVCSNYILVETLALIQHLLRMEAVRASQEDVVPLLTLEWINESIYREGVTGMLTTHKKRLSLVDCVSFDIIRRLGIKTAFPFDPHFK